MTKLEQQILIDTIPIMCKRYAYLASKEFKSPTVMIPYRDRTMNINHLVWDAIDKKYIEIHYTVSSKGIVDEVLGGIYSDIEDIEHKIIRL